MIELYTWGTPNGWKVSATLEELALDYEVKPIDIGKGEQRTPEFLAINPNGRIPAIIDRETDTRVFESGAIMIHLAEKAGALIGRNPKERAEVLSWLMFQMGGVGPMQGQANVFYRYFPEKIPAAIDRYQNETKRLYGVLDTHLKDKQWLAGDFSIADIANWAWIRVAFWAGVETGEFEHLNRWLASIEERPACRRGANIPSPLDIVEAKKAIADGDGELNKMVETARSMLQK